MLALHLLRFQMQCDVDSVAEDIIGNLLNQKPNDYLL